ncbi:equilibrative nucleoside transporter 1-like [Ptychodera flava]|uniref:equilibrative nucleoside transporter 1-like n=1 Tax=Ptychodera flava TaxID=63121 RepID=UPI00396A6E4E
MVVKRQGNGYDYHGDTKPDNSKLAPLAAEEMFELQDIGSELDRAFPPTTTLPTTTPNGSVPNGSVPHHPHSNGHLPTMPEKDESNEVTEVSVLIKSPEDTQSTTGPVDKWKLVYWIFALHGLGTLLPWNMFITAEAYFTEHKFGNVSDSAEYKDKFLSYLGIAAFVPTLCFVTVTLFIQHRTMTKSRIGYSILLMILLFALTVGLAIIDSSSWPGIFYGVTMGTVVAFNGASAVYQSSLFGFAGRLPVKYTQGVLAGQGLGGTFVSLVSILSITVASSLKAAAIGYFSCALAVLIICYATFVLMNKLPYVKFYLHQSHEDEDEPDDKKGEGPPKRRVPAAPPFLKIFWKIKWQLFNIWMVFFVTLAIFPAVLVQVEPSGEVSEFKFKYFTPLTCFLLFNMCDFVGSIFPVWFQWPRSRYLWIATTSRLIFFPIFLFSNYRPYARTLPVLINNDIVYVILVMAFSLSSGYLKSLPMMAAPKLVDPEYSATAGAMMALFLIIGIFSGLNFSLVFPALVSI